VFVVLVIAALVAEVVYATSDDPQTSSLQGNALGVLVVLTVVFAAYRGLTANKYSRPCPRCGEKVKNGILDCSCGFDFRTVGSSD
jgi:hypothetical protein